MTRLPAQIDWVNISEAAAVGETVSGGAVSGSPAPDNIHSGPWAEQSSSKLLRNIKGIIFDFDGTLFDNSLIPFRLICAYPLDIWRIWNERLNRRRFAGCDYGSSEEYYNAYFKAFGKACRRSPEYMRNWYFNRFMPSMIESLQKYYKPRPGAVELFWLLDGAHAGSKTAEKTAYEITGKPAATVANPQTLKIAIYSDYPLLKERLDALGIYPGHKTPLYGPESFGAQKPAPRPFLRIAADMGMAPEEVLVIGDREDTDGIGAFRAGMRFFCLETGRRRYFRLDPNRRPPQKKDRHGPSLVMYAGVWDDLLKALKKKYH